MLSNCSKLFIYCPLNTISYHIINFSFFDESDDYEVVHIRNCTNHVPNIYCSYSVSDEKTCESNQVVTVGCGELQFCI